MEEKSTHNFLICLLTVGLCTGFAQQAEGQVIWSEEFNSGSVPDETVWSYDLGASGWGNNELQEYTNDSANARVEDGKLIITVIEKPGGTGFTSARIRTQAKLTFKYGTVEARIRVPDLADGLWPAFWTLGNDFGTVGWPASGEIDVLEMGHSSFISAGVVNRRVQSTAHWEHNGTHADYGLTLDAPDDLNDDFHTFRLEWTPSTIETFLDGASIWTMDITPQNCTDCTEFHQPHFLLLNVAVGGNFPGIHTNSGITAPLPAEMEVDYVRIHDNGFTEMGGTGWEEGTPNLGPGHSGSWIPTAPGAHGWSIEFGTLPDGTPFAVVYWYVYTDEGDPMFFVGTGLPGANNVLNVNFESPYGMKFGEFDPDTVIREAGGTGTFDFSDRDNGTFTYVPSEFSMTNWGHSAIDEMPIVRLFAVPVDGPDY